MPAFHHRDTRKVLVVAGPLKIIDSSVHVQNPEEIPNYEWNELFDFPLEVAFESNLAYKANNFDKQSMFQYLKSFNPSDPLWITRFEDGAPQKL